MSCTTRSCSSSPYLHTSVLRSGQGPTWMVRVFAAAERALQRRQQRHALLEVDDRRLKDIGLTRDQAREEGCKPLWR